MSKLEKQHHKELKMEIRGATFVWLCPTLHEVESSDDEGDTLPDSQKIAEDNANMSMDSMPLKKRKLYEAMKIGIERKRAHLHRFKERKKMLDEAKKFERRSKL